MKKKPKKTTKKLSAKNSKILHDTMVTLGALKEQTRLNDLPMHEIQVHLLDVHGDGIVLCLEYDEFTGELNKTFHSIDETAYDEYGENDDDDDDELPPHYYGEEFGDSTDPCISPENVKEFLKKRIEETISEEYDEIFYNSDDDDDEPPPLLN